MTGAIAPPASRNSPCSCGSGRRYKECHGAIGAPLATAVPNPDVDRRNATLAAALDRQKAGDYFAADVGYRSVLAEVPNHFDALHMLGVVMLQQGRLDEAETLIARATAVRPDVVAAAQNLSRVREARAAGDVEASICRAVLPRLVRLCLSPAPVPLSDVGPGDAVQVVFAGIGSDVLLAKRIATAATSRGAAVTVGNLVGQGPRGWLSVDEGHLATLKGEAIIIVGIDTSIGDWPLTAAPRSTTLVVTRNAPCLLLDRVREASGQGRRRVALATHARSVAEAAALPMQIFAQLGGE